MTEKFTLRAEDRQEALALLHAFADRRSFLVKRNGHFDVYVECDQPELQERLANVARPVSTAPTPRARRRARPGSSPGRP